MKIAIATDNNKCSEHFGRCEEFKVYEIENKKIINEESIINPEHKFNFLPKYLKEKEIDVIISTDMGRNAQNNFSKYDIEVITGVTGSIDEIIRLYLKGELKSNNKICTRQVFKKENEN